MYERDTGAMHFPRCIWTTGQMNFKRPNLEKIFSQIVRRPLSALSMVLAVAMILVPFYQRVLGKVYLESLNYVDGSTLVMVGLLILRGVLSQRRDTDLQAISIALVGALSFLFAFEALYKLSFYILPWRMPPEELREFIIQVGITLSALVGFAFGKYRLSRLSYFLVIVFALGWAFWLSVGYPQLYDGENVYPVVLDIQLTWDMIYALNRALKVVLFLIFFTFYQHINLNKTNL
jgi:hypothetical protein